MPPTLQTYDLKNFAQGHSYKQLPKQIIAMNMLSKISCHIYESKQLVT